MNRFASLAALVIVIVAAAFFLVQFSTPPATGEFTLLFAGQQLQIGSLSVYQSGASTIGSGSAICTLVDLTGGSTSCPGEFGEGTSYRFEVTISNPGGKDSKPTTFDFNSVYAASDVIGSTGTTILSCGCYDDGSYRSGAPQLIGDNVHCTLPTGANACKVKKNGVGTDIFYFVITTGSDAGSGSGFYHITVPSKTSDLSPNISFTYCSPACDFDSDCDDTNSMTVDVCNSPGTCSASCSNTPCTVTCSLNSDCDDTNSLTIDTCLSPGTCDAACSNTPCSVTCSLDSDCDDTNSLTIDTCLNPATCDASCQNTACSVACSLDSECDDLNSSTVDSCTNPGTCDASCSNSSCSIACSTDAGCDDSDPLTIDSCTDQGTCSAACSNVACTVACSSDADCDDANDETTDACSNPDTCDASCSNEIAEVPCSTDAECDDGNPATIDSCYRPGTPGAHCLNELPADRDGPEPQIECSSDAECDDLDPNTTDSCYRPGTAGSHCIHDILDQPLSTSEGGFSIEIVDAPESTERATSTSFTVQILDADNNPVADASVSITDPSGETIQLTPLPNGKYSGSIAISPDYPLGGQSFNIIAEKGSTKEESPFALNVEKAEIRIDILSPTIPQHAVGADVGFRVRLSYPDGSAVDDATVSAVVGEKEVAFISQGEGIYVASYPLTEANLGLLEFVVGATDLAGNDGTTTISIEVLTLEQYTWFIAGFLFLLLLLLIISLLILLFYMRFKHILKLERQKAKYQLMKKHAQVMIAASSGDKKKELIAKEAYLKKKIEENNKSLALMRKRSWLTLGDIPMDLYFWAKALFYDIRHPLSIFRGRKTKASLAQVQKIDAEIDDNRELIKKLEEDFYKHLIQPEQFKKALFDRREKIHLLEIEKKKLL